MKWIFGFLLVLGIGLFALMQWGGALTGSAKNGQTLAELNPEKIKLLDQPVARQLPASAVLAVQATVAASAPLAASGATAAAVVAPAMVAAASPAALLPPPVAPIPPVPAPAVVAAAAAAVKTVAKTCLEWGEFSGTDLARAEQALANLKLGDRLATRTVEYASGYWVYIPPLKNKAALNKKIEEIKAAGIEDYYVLKDSRKWFNGISLGVFKTEEAAKKFQTSIKKKGLRTAKVGERKRTLKFTVFVLKRVDAEAAERLARLQKDYKDSELKTLPCTQ